MQSEGNRGSMTFDKKKSHALAVGLLYPSALGAGIAWWVQAFLKRSVDGAPHAPLWVLAFGLFFLLYHARQFVTQTSKWEDKPPSQYEERDFASDLIDCTALILAFVCLRLPSEDYLCVDVFGVYALAALIPVGAIITQAKKPTRGTWKTRDNWDTWFLRAIAAVVALVGLGATLWNSGWDRRGVEHRVTGPDLWVPIALWLLLGGYLFFGAWYRGKEPRGTNLPWRARVIGSGALALMVFAVIVYRTGKCGERNPIGELKSIPAGEVYGFAP